MLLHLWMFVSWFLTWMLLKWRAVAFQEILFSLFLASPAMWTFSPASYSAAAVTHILTWRRTARCFCQRWLLLHTRWTHRCWCVHIKVCVVYRYICSIDTPEPSAQFNSLLCLLRHTHTHKHTHTHTHTHTLFKMPKKQMFLENAWSLKLCPVFLLFSANQERRVVWVVYIYITCHSYKS